MAFRRRKRGRSRRSGGGFLSGIFSIIKSPKGWLVMALGAVGIFLIGGKLKDTVEGIALKAKGAAGGNSAGA